MSQKFPLEVVVSGSDKGATATLRRIGRTARQQMRDIRASSTSASDALRGIGRGAAFVARTGLVAVAAGAAAAGAAVHDFVQTGSELDDFSKKTGLSVEGIQQWRYALEQSGVPVDSFNSGINTFSKGLGQARLGTGKLAAGLKKMSPELLAQLKRTTNVDEALRLYVAAMEQIPDPSRRAALAAAAFGGAGEDMALAAEAGSAELKRLRDEKMKDGLMSAEAAARAADLGDKTDRLSSQWENLKMQVGEATVTALQPHIEALAEWALTNKDVIAENVSGAVLALRDAFASIDWDAIGRGLSFVMDLLRGVAEVAKDAAEAVRLFPRDLVNDAPWADTGASLWGVPISPSPDTIDKTVQLAENIMDPFGWNPDSGKSAFRPTGPSFNESLIRFATKSGQISEAQGQAWAQQALGFGLANITGKGTGGIFGAGAVKERAVSGPGFMQSVATGAAGAKPPSGEITIKVQSAPGTTAEVVKDTTPATVKVEGTGKRSVGGKL